MEVHDIVQEAVIKTISKEKKCKKAKGLSEEALQTAIKRREVKGRGTRDQIATSVGSRKKQESSRKHLVLLY